MYDLFLNLLRCSLWKLPFDGYITSSVFKEVLKIAEEQTVYGCVFDSMKNIQIDDMQDKTPIFEAIGLFEQIKQQNDILTKELIWFVKQINKYSVEYLLVKGQTIGILYPKPELRQSGDIDFWAQQFLQIRQFFPEAEIPDKFPEKEYAFEKNGIIYELHTELIDFGCRNNKILWQEIVNKEWEQPYYVNIASCNVRTLSPTVNAIYVFLHLFFHFIKGGISLRQLCDWMMVLHHYKNEIDRNELWRILRSLNVLNAYRAFGVILIENLGLSYDEFPLAITNDDKKWRQKILRDIFKGGNFGKQNHQSKCAFGYKMETMALMLRNCLIYYRLAPSEMRMLVPNQIKTNVKLLFPF